MSLTKVTNSMISGAPANPLDYGAVADGSTPDTTAVQDAFTASLAVNLSPGTSTYKVGAVNASATGTIFTGAGEIVNTISGDTSGNTLYAQPFRASMENLRCMVDKTGTRCLTNLLEFANVGCNAVLTDYLFGTAAKQYLDNAYALGMGVILDYTNQTPDVSNDSHPALIGYYISDEPANKPTPITIAEQNTLIATWRALTNKPLMSTFFGQYDLTPAMSNQWDVIFMDYAYRDANTDDENISIALRAFANLRFNNRQTKVIPMVGPFTETGSCTSVSKRINFSRDIALFSDDGSYAIFGWVPQSTQFPASPQNNADCYNFCAELPVLVKSKSRLDFEIVCFTPMTSGANYYCVPLSGSGDFSLNTATNGGIAFKESGGLFALSLPAMGMVDIQFLYANTADSSTTTILVYQSTDGFLTTTTLVTYGNLATNTYLNDRLYNDGNALLGILFTPASSSSTFGKTLQGFMIYNNWVTLAF